MAESQQKRLLRMLTGKFNWSIYKYKHKWKLKRNTLPGGKTAEMWYCEGCKTWK